MNPYKYQLSFRVFHPTLAPETFINMLGLSEECKHKWTKGEQIKTPKGKLLSAVHDTNYAGFEFMPLGNPSLIDHIQIILSRLNDKKHFLHEIANTGGRAELYTSFLIDGLSADYFDWAFLHKLVELKINFGFDMMTV